MSKPKVLLKALCLLTLCSSAAFETRHIEDLLETAVCTCPEDVCSLIPPLGSQLPCYEGSNEDASKCFRSDPLLSPGTIWVCGSCEALGFPVYLRNDPIYKTMELWAEADKDAGLILVRSKEE
jgi:hypothetical protein